MMEKLRSLDFKPLPQLRMAKTAFRFETATVKLVEP